MPQCAACEKHKHNTGCDITDHVMYSYETVQKLHDRITRLEPKLRQIHQQPSGAQIANIVEGLCIPQYVGVPLDIDSPTETKVYKPQSLLAKSTTVAEEVGSLTLGLMQQTSQQYSKRGFSFQI